MTVVVAGARAHGDNAAFVLSVPPSLARRAAEVEGWLELGCPEKALERVAPLLESPGGRAPGLYLRVRAYLELGEHGAALRDLKRLRPFDPDPDWIDLTEAWCEKRAGNLERAVACMQRLVERSHRSAIGHYNLGCYLALLGRKEEAIDEVTVACGMESALRNAARTETDLDSLRGDPRFEQILG